MARIDRMETNLSQRLETALRELDESAKQLAVHAVKISQEQERRERADQAMSKRLGYAEERIGVVEEFAKAHSNGRAEHG